MRRVHSSPFASALLLLPLVLAPSSTLASAGGGTEASAPENSGLAAALDAITAREIEADIHFIASDELRGRDTPSEGLTIAARYIRARLMSLGFAPGARDESFFHYYALRTTAMDAAATRLEVLGGSEPLSFPIGTGFHLGDRFLREASTQRGRVVFVGDAQGLAPDSLQGAWALVLDKGAPTGALARAAAAAGALGLILTPGPDYEEEPYDARFADRLRLLERGSVSLPSSSESRPRPEGERGERSRRGNISYLTPEAFQRLLEISPARPEGVSAQDWKPEAGTDLKLELAEHRVLKGGGEIEVENVCGFWPGSDPELAQEVILVSAHYDHVGTTGDDIYNGADDNGSGTTGLLAVARALATHGPLRRSVLLIWVSGEEKGLLGSRAWSDAPWLPGEARAVANLNIDMIGRNDPNELFITPTEKHEQHNGIVRLATRLSPLEGFPELKSADEYYYRSDQASFARLGIPVAFLFSDVHDDYHKPTDTPDKIDTDKLRRVARLIVRLLDALQTDSLEF